MVPVRVAQDLEELLGAGAVGERPQARARAAGEQYEMDHYRVPPKIDFASATSAASLASDLARPEPLANTYAFALGSVPLGRKSTRDPSTSLNSRTSASGRRWGSSVALTTGIGAPSE